MENLIALPQADRVAFAQSLLQVTQFALEAETTPEAKDLHAALVLVSSLIEPAKTH